MSRPNSKANETWMDHFERVEGLKHWDSGTKNNIFSCNYCGYNFDTNANTTDDLMHHIKSKHDITESKANEGMSECPHCDGEGSYEFRSYGRQSCSWCRGTGKLDEDQMDEFQQNEDKWNNIARMDNDTNLTTDSDIERWGESKASEWESVEAIASESGYCNKCGTYSSARSMKSHMQDKHPEVPRREWKTLEYMGSTVSGDDRYVGDDIAQRYYGNTQELEKAMDWGRKDDGWSNPSDFS